MDEEANRLGLRKAHWIDFVSVELYSNENYYSYKDTEYYIWSHAKQEFEKYTTTPHIHWRDLEVYSEILFIKDGEKRKDESLH